MFPCVWSHEEEQAIGIYQLTSVSLTDWDWDAFGAWRIYGRSDAAFLLNYSRSENNEMAWESGLMLWTSLEVNSPWLNPLHSILHPQPAAHPLFQLREKEGGGKNNPAQENNFFLNIMFIVLT